MENILQIVKNAVIRLLKDHDPETEVYTEEIVRTDETLDTGDRKNQKWYFAEVIPVSFTTIAPLQTEVSLTVSIDYYDPEESIRLYGQKAVGLDDVIRPVFRFKTDGGPRGITVPRVNVNISGGMLHLTFPLVFIVPDKDDSPELPMMEDLESIGKG